jgi:hypothetical protein
MRYLIILGCFFALNGLAQNVVLKSDFGQSGKRSLDIDDVDDLVGILKDNQNANFLYGNTSDNIGGYYPYDFFFAKMDEFGSLDPSFGTNGIVRDDFPGFSICSVNKAVLHSSGIYFIGQGINPTSVDTFHIFIGKLTLDGQIDPTFGSNGFFTDTLLGSYSTAGSIIIDDEDRVVFCGSSEIQLNQQEFPVVGRLTIDGERDSTFGGTGILYWDYYSGNITNLCPVIPASQNKHGGDGAYLAELVQVNENYFVYGRYVETAYAQVHMLAFNKQGSIPSNFISSGPLIYQLEPGYNHSVNTVEFHDDHIYLGLSTTGNTYGGKHFVQKIDSNGYHQEILSFVDSGAFIKTNFIESWNGRLFIGGFNIDSSEITPGYQSERFDVHCLNEDDIEINSFHFNEDMNSNDELGANDIELHSDYGIVGGYMNNVVADNYTDIALVAFEIEADLGLDDIKSDLRLYPNPADGYVTFSEDCIGSYSLVDSKGQLVKEGEVMSNTIDFTGISAGIYFLRIGEYFPVKLILY